MYKILILTFLSSLLFHVGCSQSNQVATTKVEETSQKPGPAVEKIEKTEEEWRAQLSETEFYILREKGTERSFTGKYWDNKKDGIYFCSGCNLSLFDAETKFKSGTGWPSFYQPIAKGHVIEYTDSSHGMARTEVVCGRCDGHLGHVFNDGPNPTGLRYCINGNILQFKEK